MSTIRYFYQWMGSRVHSPYANSMLGFLFFLEAIFFLPTDPMLAFYCLERKNKAFFYATIATVASVLGSLVSYALGAIIWDQCGTAITHNSVMNFFIKPETFTYVCNQFQEHDWVALLLAGFTPIPFKAATMVAGFCHLNLLTFIACVTIARGIRFYCMAAVIYSCGRYIKEYLDRYLNLITIAMVLIFIAYILYVHYSR